MKTRMPQLFCTRMMRYFYLAVTALSLAACSPKENPTRSTEDLDAYFRQQMPAGEPGGAILIMENDSVLFSKGYGVADISTKEPITPQTLFNLGSISKTFVANAILMLQEQGKLSVDDSLILYFPEFKNKDLAARVKIRHLLTHTSGLPDNRKVSKDTVFYLSKRRRELVSGDTGRRLSL
jgi:CubicO group peptidase (beta-lactamase class C family)